MDNERNGSKHFRNVVCSELGESNFDFSLSFRKVAILVRVSWRLISSVSFWSTAKLSVVNNLKGLHTGHVPFSSLLFCCNCSSITWDWEVIYFKTKTSPLLVCRVASSHSRQYRLASLFKTLPVLWFVRFTYRPGALTNTTVQFTSALWWVSRSTDSDLIRLFLSVLWFQNKLAFTALCLRRMALSGEHSDFLPFI
jgi:hypothetical protein